MPLPRQELERILAFLQEAPVRISVFGEFSAGKSTFLNALMGEEILSVATEPTTAVPTFIRYAREFNIEIQRQDGQKLVLFDGEPPVWTRFVGRGSVLNTLRRQQHQIREFLARWTKEGEQAGEVRHTTIQIPLEWLKRGLELVDTPGANNEYTVHRKFTEQVAGESDIAILIMDAASGGGRRTEYDFFNSVNRRVSQVVLVVTKMDRLDPEERQELLEEIRTHFVPKYWQGSLPPTVWGLSAKTVLDPDLGSRSPELVKLFREFVIRLEDLARSDRGKILLHRLGNPEKRLFSEALAAEQAGLFDEAHAAWLDLSEILKMAGMDDTPARDGIQRGENELKKQFKSLDLLNGLIVKAFELEKTDPDQARAILARVQADLLNLKTRDPEVAKGLKRIGSRIKKRDRARKSIEGTKQSARKHFSDELFIEAAAVAETLVPQLTQAELSEEDQKSCEELVQHYLRHRDEWVDSRWRELEAHCRSLLAEREFNEAAEAIPELEKIASHLKVRLPCRQLVADLKQTRDEWRKYEDLCRSLAECLIPLLRQPSVSQTEIQAFFPDLDWLAKLAKSLFVVAGNWRPPETAAHADLAIGQKVYIAGYLRKRTRFSSVAAQFELLWEDLEQHSRHLETINGTIVRAFEVEKAEPDQALAILIQARADLLILQIRDPQVDKGVNRISARIKKRDQARAVIQRNGMEAREHFARGQPIEAAAVAETLAVHLKPAELSEENRETVVELVEFYRQQREEWVEARWSELEELSKSLLAGCRFNEAAEVIPELEKIAPFLKDCLPCQRLVETLKQSVQHREGYEDLCRSMADRLIPLLEQPRVSLAEMRTFYPDLERLAGFSESLYSVAGGWMHSERSGQLRLSIDQKLAVASFLRERTRFSAVAARFAKLWRDLQDRSEQLGQVVLPSSLHLDAEDLSESDLIRWSRDYPDHRAFAEYDLEVGQQIQRTIEELSRANLQLKQVELLVRLAHLHGLSGDLGKARQHCLEAKNLAQKIIAPSVHELKMHFYAIAECEWRFGFAPDAKVPLAEFQPAYSAEQLKFDKYKRLFKTCASLFSPKKPG